MFKSIGLPEIILILVVILIFFGVGKLPQVGESVGKAIRAFKRSQTDDEEEEATKPKKSSAKKATKSSKTTSKTA